MDKVLTDNDPWLESLVWLCEHYQLRRHPQQLLAGLPLEGGQLCANTFTRAASQAGFDISRRPLAEANSAVLPLLASNQQGQPLLITGLTADTATILLAADNMAEKTLPRTQLEQQLQGAELWWLAPQRVTDARAELLAASSPRHWLLQAIVEVKPWYRDLLLASLVINILALIVPLFTMNVYDRVVPNQAFHTLWVLSAAVAVAIVFDWLLRKARSRLTDLAGREIDVKISSMLYAKVLGMTLESRPASAGAFAKQVQEFDSVREFLTSATLNTAIDLPFSLLFLLLIFWLGGPMVLIPIAAVVVLIALSFYLKEKIKETIEESGRLSTQRQAILIEQVQLLADTKQNNAEGQSQRRWEQTVAALSDWQNQSREYSNTLSYTVMNVQHLVTVGLILTGVYRISEGLLSMGGLIAIVMLSGRAASAINQLSILLMRYEQTRSAIAGLETVMQTPQEQHPQQATETKQFDGAIKLSHVCFHYPEKELAVLDDINLAINAGERVGIIGPAGAGKSTLMALLAHQLRPGSGRIEYSGIEASQWPVSALRDQCGWVGQQPLLMFGSILDNISFGLSTLNTQQLSHAIEASGINRFVDRLENGLETPVGELGMALSGGQRQAVALARALVRQPALLLLDEPTSAMDTALEQQVLAGLRQQPASTGMIIASHRPALLQLCDRLIVLEGGRIIDDGPTAQILTRQAAPKPRTRRVQSVKIAPRPDKGGQHE
ncbi:type I secretion system permease/ATPase [Oceanicoccus sagamiensis]|uniref:Type I secretion system permease/ATPase n=1 Tax=Oceanicoccus sagamiensis TaxID=716816 RepID=A0A1X9NC20_9GAMM|nr:type I secretion system permease/ATPase [Oceanicoccus sagamiensis]ARN75146.1 type I secretion system permease/ATPase [Oceanicoccus sagamiensis]